MTKLSFQNQDDEMPDDDGYAYIPTNDFDFFFFGENYGTNSRMYWNTNSVLGFGDGNESYEWDEGTGLGILLGHSDRFCDAFWHSPVRQINDIKVMRLLHFGRNYYNDDTSNTFQYEMFLARDTSHQFIELRIGAFGENLNPDLDIDSELEIGLWNITNGTTFQNTMGVVSPVVGNSYVLVSDLLGYDWRWFPNSSLSIPL